MKDSEYLLANGWLPSPSSRGLAWEGPLCYRVNWPVIYGQLALTAERWLQDSCMEAQRKHDERLSRQVDT